MSSSMNCRQRSANVLDVGQFTMLTQRLQPSITYSRGIQTTSTSTGSDSDEPDPDRDRQSGRETEAEMRQRLQAEFEAERDRLERAIREEEEQKRRDEAKITGAHDQRDVCLSSVADLSYIFRIVGRGTA